MYTYENELNRSVPTDPELCAVNPILLDILFRRGFKTDAAMRDILFPDRKKAFQPLNCQDIDAVLSILENAVQNQTAMAVYHNYDTDGIAAGAVGTRTAGRMVRSGSVRRGSRKFKSGGRKLNSFLQRALGSWNTTPLTMPTGRDSLLW